MHFRLLLLVLLVPTVVQAQTVTKVIDGVTVGLDSGDIVRLKGFALSQDKATRERSRKLLISFVLDRPVVLEDSQELGWGQSEATVTWRGIDIGGELKKRGVVISTESIPQQQPVQQQYIPPVQHYYVPPPQQPVRQYYSPEFSSYTPPSTYCVGNT